MALILFFTLILNVVAIILTYNCLSNIEKKERIIVIAVGVAIIYALTSFVYWISTKDVAIKEVSELGKNIITFLFVPINSIIVLPLMAKSYNKYKIGRLALDKFRNRGIVLGVILLIILIIECSYFKDIQNGVVSLIEEYNTKAKQETQQNGNVLNDIQEDLYISNEIANTETNQVINQGIVNNEINETNNVNSENTNLENVTNDIIY